MTTEPQPPTPEPSPRWKRVARVEDLRGDGPLSVSVDGTDLVVLRTSGSLRAYEGRCPHQGALLGEGEIDGTTLVCRNHRWRFDSASGQRDGGPQCLRACAIEERDGGLWVDARGAAAFGVSNGARVTGAARAAKPPSRTWQDLPGPRGIPILGNALQLETERVHDVFEGWQRKFGNMFAFRLGPRRNVAITDPVLAEQILRARPESYRRIGDVEPVFREMHVEGVFSAEGATWRSQRRLAMEALAHRHLRQFYPTLRKVAERLHRRFQAAARDGRTVTIQDDLMRFTVDVTTSLAFGIDTNTLEGGEDVIQKHLSRVFPAFGRRISAVFPYWRYFRLPEDRRLDHALHELQRWIGPLITETRARLDADPARAANPCNFLEAMIVARDADGQPFSEEVIFGNAMTMLLAGEDTTALTLAWAVHHLCDSPADVARLRRELDERLGPDASVPIDIESASALPFADAVANETMRLRPVAPFFFLETNEDVVLDDVAIPKGTGIILLTRISATDDRNFANASEFRPARWTDEAARGGVHRPAVSVPFGSGPRICPGRSLALLEMRIVLAALYKNFQIDRVGSSRDVHERWSFTMAPSGVTVRLRELGR